MIFSLVSILSRLPLRVLYWVADWLLYPLIYYIARYRRKVVDRNLLIAFPQHTPPERKRIAHDFYHQFCNTIVEIIYGYRCSEEEMRERVIFENTEEVNQLVEKAGGGIFMLAHMGNWEWMASIQQWLNNGITEVNVYRTLKNKRMDRLMLAIRARRGGVCVEKQRILREMLRYRAEKRTITVGLLSDQKTRPEVTKTWVTFMGQTVGFLEGGEVLGKKFNYPVFYAHITRTGRGYYQCVFRVLSATPTQTLEGEITAAYARSLEANIYEQPALWLWTHNRFKYCKKEQGAR